MTKDEMRELIAEAKDMWCPPQPTPMDDMIIRLTAALEEAISVAASARANALGEAEQECEDVAKLGLVLGDPKYAVGAGACLGRIRALAAKET